MAQLGARWFSCDDVRRGKASGLPAGGHPGCGLWLLPSNEHSITVGRTGSGKTLSYALPGLLLHALAEEKNNLLVVDAKGTIFSAASGILQESGYRIRLIDMRSSKSPNTWNPLDGATAAYRQGDTKRAEELIADITASLKKAVKNSQDAFWENVAADLIAAVYFVLLDADGKAKPSLCDVSDNVSKGAGHLKNLALSAGGIPSSRLEACLKVVEAKETWACVQSVFFTAMSFYGSAVGHRVASASNFDPTAEILSEGNPVAIFIISPDESTSCNGYVSLFFDTLYQTYVTRFELDGLDAKGFSGVRCFIDEAARFPFSKLNSLMSTARSREFFVHLFLQSFSQLLEERRYDEAGAAVLIEQAATVICMSNADRWVIEYLKNRSNGLVNPSMVAGLETGEAIVSRLDKPLARMKLAPIGEYVRAGLISDLHPADLEVNSCRAKFDKAGVGDAASIERAVFSHFASC